MRTVIVSGPELEGAYTVLEQRGDGSLLLAPVRDRSFAEVCDELGLTPVDGEAFEAEHGRALPPDGEG